MMQEEHVIEKIRSSYKFVDIIFGTHNIFKLAELLKARVDSKGMIVDIWFVFVLFVVVFLSVCFFISNSRLQVNES